MSNYFYKIQLQKNAHVYIQRMIFEKRMCGC